MKRNIEGTNDKGEDIRTQINHLEQKEEINIQPEQNEETRIQKLRKGLGNSRTTLNIPNHRGARRRKGRARARNRKLN